MVRLSLLLLLFPVGVFGQNRDTLSSSSELDGRMRRCRKAASFRDGVVVLRSGVEYKGRCVVSFVVLDGIANQERVKYMICIKGEYLTIDSSIVSRFTQSVK